MQLPDGKLSLSQREMLAAWLNRHFKDQHCDICRSVNWSIGEHLLHGQIWTGGGLVVGGPAYPQAFIACNTCGNTRLFMAAMIGLVSSATPPPPLPLSPRGPPKPGGGD